MSDLPPPAPPEPDDPTVPTHGASLDDGTRTDPTPPTPPDDGGPADDGAPPGGTRGLRGRSRLAVLAACVLVTVVSAVVLVVRLRHDDPTPPVYVGLDAWAPYWTLDESVPEVSERAAGLHELSPFWFKAERADSIVPDEQAPKQRTEAFLRRARAAGARTVPSVVDGLPPGAMAAVLADPGQRAVHVKALGDFAAKGDYAGLDIDYESFAFKDDRASWSTTRPAWVAFVKALAERLHADGRTLTVSIPPVYDD